MRKKLLQSEMVVTDKIAGDIHENMTVEEMKMELAKNTVMLEIVQLLESEKQIEEILYDILEIAGNYINVTNANVVKTSLEGKALEEITQWTKDSKYLTFKEDIKASITLPIEINGKVAMYVNLIDYEQDKKWEKETVTFLKDMVKIMRSILLRKITKNSIASSYASLEAILENVGSGIYVTDKETNEILLVNQILRETFSKEISEGSLKKLFSKSVKMNERADYSELYYPRKKHWYDLHYTDIVWVDGRNVSLCTVYDITDKKLYQQKIEMQANNDFLTGLHNRMRCEYDLEKYIKDVKAIGGKGALLYLDLDDFKHINDGLGHQYGDILLQEIAHSIQKIPEIKSNCYRMGGDEFIILITKEYYHNMGKILDNISEIFSEPWQLKGAEYYCTMSMGIVRFPQDGDTVHDLIKKSDIAMYDAKRHGKNGISYYDEDAGKSSYRRLDLEKNMRDATANGCKEFEIYYQPIIDIQKEKSRCVGAEALIRWNNKKLGFISPVDFIPLAEYLGLINPIGNYVLREACLECKAWNDSGYPGYKVNVNLSVVQLLQNDIVETISNAVNISGINPSNLTLEVTESLAINDMNRMKKILKKIRDLGVRIALDDFGTGYSSLNHIKEIPLDVIKVDRSFIQDIVEDEYACSFVKMIGELAGTIGVNTCIEGVESEEQYQLLKNMKISMIQGYYFGEPMKGKDFEKKYIKGLEN